MNLILILKLVLVPILIGCITLAGRRWGPAVAGWLSAFPVVAGPILLFVAIEQGAPFAEMAAKSTLSAVVAIVVFGLSYSWAATRFSWSICLTCGFFCYGLAVVLLKFFELSLLLSTPLVLVSLLIAPYLYPRFSAANYSASSSPGDLILRMCAGAILVFVITHFSLSLGAHLSGLLAVFPVMASVLVIFTHRQAGGVSAIQLLRGTLFGYYAFASFAIALALMLPRFSVAKSFLAAFVIAAVVQVISRRYLQQNLQRNLQRGVLTKSAPVPTEAT